jgi:hypothetical protein
MIKKIIFFLAISYTSCFAQDSYIPVISKARTMEEVDRTKFEEYKYRRYSRWRSAIETRRELNAGKVHRYWTAVPYYVNPMGTNWIQNGMVRQPPLYGGRFSYRERLDYIYNYNYNY